MDMFRAISDVMEKTVIECLKAKRICAIADVRRAEAELRSRRHVDAANFFGSAIAGTLPEKFI